MNGHSPGFNLGFNIVVRMEGSPAEALSLQVFHDQSAHSHEAPKVTTKSTSPKDAIRVFWSASRASWSLGAIERPRE